MNRNYIYNECNEDMNEEIYIIDDNSIQFDCGCGCMILG
jgi:hypothetical protein